MTGPGRPVGPASTGLANRMMIRLLTSRWHRPWSRWFCVIDYRGRRSGRRYRTPTQYGERPDGAVLILAGGHEHKTWWRNFTGDGHELRLILRGSTVRGRATAHRGDMDPTTTERLLGDLATARPRLARFLPSTVDACVVLVRPR